MKKPTYKVRSAGATLVVTLPRSVLHFVPLIAGSEVEIVATGYGGKIIVTPVKPLKNGAKHAK